MRHPLFCQAQKSFGIHHLPPDFLVSARRHNPLCCYCSSCSAVNCSLVHLKRFPEYHAQAPVLMFLQASAFYSFIILYFHTDVFIHEAKKINSVVIITAILTFLFRVINIKIS
jgi:hypothetical protein